MIYINGRFLTQPQTGVNRYAYELCMALKKLKVDFVIICPKQKIENYNIKDFKIKYFGKLPSQLWEQIDLFLFYSRIKGDKILLNFTGLGPVFLRNKIMTIHDLSYMINSKWFSFSYRLFYSVFTPISAHFAQKILTVSFFSKHEIMRLLNIREDKIHVIYNAVSENIADNTSNSKTNEKYVLAVSSIDPRKNLNRLIESFKLVRNKNKDIKLYIVGGFSKVHGKEKLENTDGVEFLGRVSDSKLYSLYTNAVCFIYPSLYEGFGIPPLEAMKCKCPCIVSDIEVLKEVCGDAALYVNPYNEVDIAEKIIEMNDNNKLRLKIIEKGIIREQIYSWENSARKLLNIIS